MEVINENNQKNIILEVEQHLSPGRVRCISLKPTEELSLGEKKVKLNSKQTMIGKILNLLLMLFLNFLTMKQKQLSLFTQHK